jgi:hypothetical protein
MRKPARSIAVMHPYGAFPRPPKPSPCSAGEELNRLVESLVRFLNACSKRFSFGRALKAFGRASVPRLGAGWASASLRTTPSCVHIHCSRVSVSIFYLTCGFAGWVTSSRVALFRFRPYNAGPLATVRLGPRLPGCHLRCLACVKRAKRRDRQ